MKSLILVSGHVAAYKSTLSNRLSKDLGIVCLNKDLIKEILGDTAGYQNREENYRLSIATFEIMLHVAIKHLDHHESIILESNFRPHEVEKIKETFKDKDVQIITVWLTGDPLTLYERYVKREPERHHVHRSTKMMSKEVFLNAVAPFDETVYEPPVVMLDTTHFTDEKYHDLVQKLKVYL
ncbi:MAG: AAA family ATPase [Acholeplasmataceae bacterium]